MFKYKPILSLLRYKPSQTGKFGLNFELDNGYITSRSRTKPVANISTYVTWFA